MYAKENGCGWAILNNADIHTYAKNIYVLPRGIKPMLKKLREIEHNHIASSEVFGFLEYHIFN